jgi:exosome complex component CSL4
VIGLARTGKKVLPGDEVAIAEEYMSGEGTYEMEGKVYASAVGELDLDPREKTVKVILDNPPVVLSEGDTVIGEVTDARPAMAIVNIMSQEGRERSVSSETLASIHVSKLSSSYVEDAGDVMRPGDIIRATVIQVEPSVQLSTTGPHFGVIRALCSRCRNPLEKRGHNLYCERDDITENRKLADDYRAFDKE